MLRPLLSSRRRCTILSVLSLVPMYLKRSFTMAPWYLSAFMLRCFTQPDSSLVLTPGSAAESLCTRNESEQQISSRSCCSWIPHAAARVAACKAASPLEREMTLCVVELVSNADCPITTLGLLLRSVSCVAQSLSAYAFLFCSRLRTTMQNPACARGTATTRRARASVPHVARVTSITRFSANTPTRLRNQDFCSSLNSFVESLIRLNHSWHNVTKNQCQV